jgi:L-lysine exporter family protein LysE/ArgO
VIVPILKGILLGLGAAVPLGPVNVEIARRALRNGMPAGFFLGLGAVTIDVLYAVLTAIGMRSLLAIPGVTFLLSIGGIALLAYLGISCIRAAFRSRNMDFAAGASPASPHNAYLTGLLMTLLNPMTLAFWFLAVPQLTTQFSDQLPLVCVGVFLATVTWVIAFSSLMGFLGRYRRPFWLILADLIGGAILLSFAAIACVRFAGSFL